MSAGLAFRATRDAVNDISDPAIMTHLLEYDTNYRRFLGDVERTADGFVADGERVRILAERDPRCLPWKALRVDVVVESTGLFREASKARAHLDAGASKVIVTAPAKHEDLTVVLGVNERSYDPARHHIISNASCTTKDWPRREGPLRVLRTSCRRRAEPCAPSACAGWTFQHIGVAGTPGVRRRVGLC